MADVVVENGVGENVFIQIKDNDEDFIEAAGLQRTKYSGRKSSVEKLLEESLGTLEISSELSNDSPSSSPKYQPSSPIKNTSSPSREPILQNLNSDEFIADAGLNKSGSVRTRKSSRERLLEEELNTFESPPQNQTSNNYTRTQSSESRDSRKMSDSSDGRKISTGSEASTNSTEQERPRRRSSVYQQKQIEAPTATKGNRIAARTQNLFQQYERDYSGIEKKRTVSIDDELANNEIGLGSRKASYSKATRDEPKTEDVKLAKEKELNEVRQLYQQRLLEEETEALNRKTEKILNEDIKYTKRFGDVKQQYLRSTSGGSRDEDEKEELYDSKGTKIERSGGKIEIVPSSNSVKNIKNHFGSIGKAGWKKRQKSSEQVDSDSVNSARNLFKNIENKKEESLSYNRPTQRKIRDPKQLMEMRKKMTYGNDTEELPQDGVIKKSVVIENNELGDKKSALNLYRTLERGSGSNVPIQKPKTRLLSDTEAKLAMDVKRESEANDDAHNETVSGYGSGGTPCSPVSSVSDDYSTFPDGTDMSINVSIDISKDLNENNDSISEIDIDGHTEYV